MSELKNTMPPHQFLQSLRQMKADIISGDLTKEDAQVLLQDVEKMKELLLELKSELTAKAQIQRSNTNSKTPD